MSHPLTRCAERPHSARYHKSWSKEFYCPVCDKHQRQNTNFLGSWKLCCNGDKIVKLQPNDIQLRNA